jgi:hypothetical protein
LLRQRRAERLPELVNSEPYEGGWIFKIKASDESQVAALLDATAYEALLEDECCSGSLSFPGRVVGEVKRYLDLSPRVTENTIHCTFQEPSLMTQTLSQLENRGAFIERHIGPDAQQQQEMLKRLADSLNALIGQIVPKDIQLPRRRRWGSHHRIRRAGGAEGDCRPQQAL